MRAHLLRQNFSSRSRPHVVFAVCEGFLLLLFCPVSFALSSFAIILADCFYCFILTCKLYFVLLVITCAHVPLHLGVKGVLLRDFGIDLSKLNFKRQLMIFLTHRL